MFSLGEADPAPNPADGNGAHSSTSPRARKRWAQLLKRVFATDLMVWNVTKDAITLREAVIPDRVTPPSTTKAYKKATRSGEATMSKYIMDGVWKGFTPPPLPEK